MEPDQLFARALALLAARPLSRYELSNKLTEIAEREQVEEVLERISEFGYLNDRRLAETFLATHPGYGPAKLRRHLAGRGISPEIISALMSEYDPFKAGVRLLESHSWSHQGHEDKAVRYLLRKGFSLTQARNCYLYWNKNQNHDF